MGHLDADYVAEVIRRLERIPHDGAPAWGALRKDTLIEHLVWCVSHAMGRSAKVPRAGNRVIAAVMGPLALRGWLPLSWTARLPRSLRTQGIETREPGDLETLHALLEEYLTLVQADELTPAPHPCFGRIGVDGWDRLHVLHFEHHLRQFGV